MRPIDQQTILVTGATDGLGRAVARELASSGATVLLHGRSESRLANTEQEIRRATGSDRIRTCVADFASPDEVRRFGTQLLAAEGRLDVLVNNAGIGGGRHSSRQRPGDDKERRKTAEASNPQVRAEFGHRRR